MASPSQSEPVIRLEKLTRAYRSGAAEIVIFRDLELEVAAGEQVAVMGESGAGKSTLLYLIAGLDRPTSGAVRIHGRDIAAMSEAEVARFRNREIGYVWQQHHLLGEFTCAENVMMPRLVAGESQGKAMEEAKARLAEVGLADRAAHRAGELSGGEQQRVAIARALIGNPSLLLADEPTGNLDERTGEKVFEMLTDLRRTRNLTSVLVTHNPHFAQSCGRVLRLEAGTLCGI
ncbi:MAG TPA: ABC transporter ATP-binding protein [Bryobacteraceae bacterium]|nr:ABC transporter ATP-binding protein [Bryobacteraceae bacterium]